MFSISAFLRHRLPFVFFFKVILYLCCFSSNCHDKKIKKSRNIHLCNLTWKYKQSVAQSRTYKGPNTRTFEHNLSFKRHRVC